MQRILIDRKIRLSAHEFADKLKIAVPDVDNDLLQLKSDLFQYQGTHMYDGYIDEIRADYPGILTAEPEQLSLFAAKYTPMLTKNQLKAKVAYGVYATGQKAGQQRSKKFYELIIDKMGYKFAREILVPIVSDLGIKSCVYCNAQYAIGTKSGKGLYELDHLFPESLYPALCVSFYNLQPCCASCNNSKRDKSLNYLMYTTDRTKLEPVHLLVNWKRYNPVHSYKSLSIDLIPNSVRDIPLKRKFEEYFSIHGVYEMHRDIAEEAIWKLKCYDRRYVEMFKRRYGPVFSRDALYRFILGVRADKENVFARPLSKLIHDLKEDMGVVL